MLQVVLRHLLSLKLSCKTLHKHRDNLWLLGGELIRDLHEVPRLRKRPIAGLVLAALDDEGGPLISHGARRPAALLRRHLPKNSITSSRTATPPPNQGCGHVDNAEEALPSPDKDVATLTS
jgi:hypothetical protein